jgi:hypothetical protein
MSETVKAFQAGAFQAGDKVEIVGAGRNGSSAFVGHTQVINRIWADGSGANCEGWDYPASSLRLITAPALAPGVRVRVISGVTKGREGVIENVFDQRGGDRVYYEMSGLVYEANELEVLPEPVRVPAAGEVWRYSQNGNRYMVISIGKQREGDTWHPAVIYRAYRDGEVYSRRLEAFMDRFRFVEVESETR